MYGRLIPVVRLGNTYAILYVLFVHDINRYPPHFFTCRCIEFIDNLTIVYIDKQWEHNTALGDSCSCSAPDSRIQNIFLLDCLKLFSIWLLSDWSNWFGFCHWCCKTIWRCLDVYPPIHISRWFTNSRVMPVHEKLKWTSPYWQLKSDSNMAVHIDI